MLRSGVIWSVVNGGDEWTRLHIFRTRLNEEMDKSKVLHVFYHFCNFLSPVARDSFLCHVSWLNTQVCNVMTALKR